MIHLVIMCVLVYRFSLQVPRRLFGEWICNGIRTRSYLWCLRRTWKFYHLDEGCWCGRPLVGRRRTQQSRDLLPRQQGRHGFRVLPAHRSRRIQDHREIRRQAHQWQPLRRQNYRFVSGFFRTFVSFLHIYYISLTFLCCIFLERYISTIKRPTSRRRSQEEPDLRGFLQRGAATWQSIRR